MQSTVLGLPRDEHTCAGLCRARACGGAAALLQPGSRREGAHSAVRLTRPPAIVPLMPSPRQEEGSVPVSRLALAFSICSSCRFDHSDGREPVSVLLLRLTLRSRVLSDHDAGTDPANSPSAFSNDNIDYILEPCWQPPKAQWSYGKPVTVHIHITDHN